MKKRMCIVLFIVFFLSELSLAQNFTIFLAESFESGNSYFALNAGVSGLNLWTVNNNYSGNGAYPDTPSQDSTTGSIGQIGNPGGNYLHIRDVSTAVALNSTYNPANAADRWAKMNTDFCTFGYTRIVLNFWWMAQGSPADYGEVYYSTDGGATWLLATNWIGKTRYNNSDKWQFTKIEDPVFLNKSNLRFAFRWVNDGMNTGDSLPFSIDDIMIAAYYDTTTVNLNAINFTPNPICHEDTTSIYALVQIEDTLCPGTYDIEFSDSAGSFTNSIIIATFTYPATGYFSGYLNVYGQLPVPTILPLGSCYKYRINRITPPIIQGNIYGGCIQIIDCPDSITTLQPAVTKYPPVCVSSVIDVPFYSYGAYNPGNNYILELSDSLGSFTVPTVIGGPIPDTRTWDPGLPYMPPPPGSITGQIPKVPDGCNYYVRVVSTNPAVQGKPWGPFCIFTCSGDPSPSAGGGGGGGGVPQGGTSYTVCINDTSGDCFSIPPNVISAFDTSKYDTFLVQIFDTKTMALLNQGGLSVIVGSPAGNISICAPKLSIYKLTGLALKGYYMNIIGIDSTDTSTTNIFGFVRLTVNGVSGKPIAIKISPIDSVYCGSLTTLTFTAQGGPFAPGAKFIWTIDNYSNPPLSQSISLNVKGLNTGYHKVTVREVPPNGDTSCAGPLSEPIYFYVKLLPDVTMNGPTTVCVGDVVTYTSNFEPETYYEWTFNGEGVGTVLVMGNNQITVRWENVGSGTIKLVACNNCDNTVFECVDNAITVNVMPGSLTSASPDTIICESDTIMLRAINITWPIQSTYTWFSAGDTLRSVYVDLGGDSMPVFPNSTTTYIVRADNKCPDEDTVLISVIEIPFLNVSDAAICPEKNVILDATISNGTSYLWTPSEGLDNVNIATPLANPVSTTSYIVSVGYDSLCPVVKDTAVVTVNSLPLADAGQDVEIFEGEQTTLNASGGLQYFWRPPYGLTDTSAANPLAKPDTTTTYIVRVTDINGCEQEDTLKVTVIPAAFAPAVPDAFTPNGDNVNDILYVYDILGRKGDAVTSSIFQIFNRWGEMIFETEDISKGWDGKHYRSGNDMEIGVYVWLFQAETIKNEKIGPINGNVSLIR